MLGPIDLSRAAKLKDVVFQCAILRSGWVIRAPETIAFQHRNLQQTPTHTPRALSYTLRENGVAELIEGGPNLDRLLVRFWDSYSIRPKVIYPRKNNVKRTTRDWVGDLLPEITKRGIIDIVEESSVYQ